MPRLDSSLQDQPDQRRPGAPAPRSSRAGATRMVDAALHECRGAPVSVGYHPTNLALHDGTVRSAQLRGLMAFRYVACSMLESMDRRGVEAYVLALSQLDGYIRGRGLPQVTHGTDEGEQQ